MSRHFLIESIVALNTILIELIHKIKLTLQPSSVSDGASLQGKLQQTK